MKEIARVNEIFGERLPAPLADRVVLSRLQELCDALGDEGIIVDDLADETLRRLALLAWQSPHLSQLCLADPSSLALLVRENDLAETRTVRDYERIFALLPEQTAEQFDNNLRILHKQELLRIAWRHICDLADMDCLMLELSDLAECTIHIATETLYLDAVAQFGSPQTQSGQEATFSIFGMGKLGGRELNFSSDIDILFVYRGEGKTAGGKSESIENQVFFERVASAVYDFLSRPTTEGFLYRVDTRLRPQGSRGPLVPSLEAVETYYQNWGENWERQALLKIRTIAGDPSLGEDVLHILVPFSYRKYVDEVEIADTLRGMDDMRRRMIQELSPEDREVDLKIGPGGIRDVEFIVQAVQMLYGGQYPEVRLAGTLESLRRMHESGLLHSRDYDTLSNGYLFLRRVEHRLQIDQVRQTYQIPSSLEAREDLAVRLGYETYASFDRTHRDIRTSVRATYEGIFGRQEWEDQTEGLLDSSSLSEPHRQMLKEHGFEDPDRAHRNLISLGDNPSTPHLKAKTKRLFKTLLPRLLLYLKECPDADMSLDSLEQIVDRLGARTTLYSIMSDNPQLVELLVILTGGSRYLSSILLRDPSLAETLGRKDTLQGSLTQVSFADRLSLLREAHSSREDLHTSLARFKNAIELETGTRYLLGICDVQSLSRDLAGAADYILHEAIRETGQEMQRRYPDFFEKSSDALGVIALGKFGGRELNFASDLDMIFLHAECESSDEITDTEFFSRWVTKISQFLSASTPFGRLYECDFRLRPHGKSGNPSTSLTAFGHYVQEKAWVWERLALSRCRPVIGTPRWTERFKRVWHESLFSRPFTKKEKRKVVEMRFRIEREKGDAALKAGPGGLVDMEFIAQTLRLCHGKEHEAMCNPSTMGALTAAAELGFLSEKTARELRRSYLFLRDIENRLQIVDHLSIDRLPTDKSELDGLAKRCFPKRSQPKLSGEDLVQEVESHTRRVRGIFNDFFQV
ncbi:MAG: bifunctional [glutamate--ammonia ligase]-adenylyl-L-tyrosine phosphorylase/[glutamate--ammonia-ligase] adenylyltransferase [bacterium]